MPIIIWFDDGLESTYTNAFPIMESYGYKGVAAILTDYVGGEWHDVNPEGVDYGYRKMLSLDQIKELHSAGWNIESHSATHAHFPDLTQLEALQELTRSYRWILQNLKTRPMAFAYPWGAVEYELMAGSVYPFLRISSKKGLWDGRSKVIPGADYDIPEPDSGDVGWDIVLVQEPPAMYDQKILEILLQSQNNYAVWLFHGVKVTPEDPWELTPGQFEAIIQNIGENGERVVTLHEALLERNFPFTLRRSALSRI